MVLNVKDRIIIAAILPGSGDFIEIGVKEEILELIKFSDEENRVLNIRDFNGRSVWDPGVADQDFGFTGTQIEFLKKQVERINNEKGVTSDSISTLKKIRNA